MTALTLYGSNVASSTLGTACKLADTTGGTETNVTTTGPSSGNGYVEIFSQAATASLNASLPSPDGKGWLYDNTNLENQTISTGNWSASIAVKDTAGSGPVQSFVIRFYKRSSGGVYTSIGSLTLSSQTINTTRTVYNFSASSLSSMSFGSGEKLYCDLFIQATGWSSDPIVNYVSNSGTAGVANDLQITTPGYSPTATTQTETVTETATGSEIVTATGLTRASETITETATGSEIVTTSITNVSIGTVMETATGSEVVAIASTMLSDPAAQMTKADLAFEYNHLKVSPVGSALKILATVYYASTTNSQVINGELDALLQPESIAALHVMKTRNDVLAFIRSYSYEANVLADVPQAYYRLNETSGTTVADISGRGYTGTIHGSVTFSQAGALAVSTDTSMQFDGSTAYISLPTILLPNITAFSVECWFKVAATANLANSPVFVGNDDPQHNLVGFNFGAFPHGTDGLFFNVAINGVWKQATSSTIFAANTWYRVAATYDGVTLRIYTNGVQTGSLAASGVMTVSNNPVLIGAMIGPTAFLNGFLDECSIYNTALSASRILAHYNAGISP